MGDYMEIYTVSFFGHRELSDGFEIEKELEKLVRELIRKKEYIDFLVGCNGEFDTLVSSVIRRIMKENDYGNASHILVLPYQTAEYRDNAENLKEYYTEIEICGQSAAAHFRSAFQIRNRAMVESFITNTALRIWPAFRECCRSIISSAVSAVAEALVTPTCAP